MPSSDLIKKIYNRAAELQKKSLKAATDEGIHRSSANDEYYRGGADALLDLARELETNTSLITQNGTNNHARRQQ